jgi:hypothetical protein
VALQEGRRLAVLGGQQINHDDGDVIAESARLQRSQLLRLYAQHFHEVQQKIGARNANHTDMENLDREKKWGHYCYYYKNSYGG